MALIRLKLPYPYKLQKMASFVSLQLVSHLIRGACLIMKIRYALYM